MTWTSITPRGTDTSRTSETQMRSLTYFVPSRDVFVARRRREWQWARRPNYELFSLRHGAPLYCRCTYLAPPPSSRVRVRKSEKERASCGDGTTGVETRNVWGREREDVSAGFPPPLMGMRYELFVGCSLAFSHCYATVLLASASPSCTPTKGINVNARCHAMYTLRRGQGK